MKNIKLLIIMLFFINLLAGCGMAGPLYKPTAPVIEQQDIAPEKTQSSPAMPDSDAIEASASE